MLRAKRRASRSTLVRNPSPRGPTRRRARKLVTRACRSLRSSGGRSPGRSPGAPASGPGRGWRASSRTAARTRARPSTRWCTGATALEGRVHRLGRIHRLPGALGPLSRGRRSVVLPAVARVVHFGPRHRRDLRVVPPPTGQGGGAYLQSSDRIPDPTWRSCPRTANTSRRSGRSSTGCAAPSSLWSTHRAWFTRRSRAFAPSGEPITTSASRAPRSSPAHHSPDRSALATAASSG